MRITRLVASLALAAALHAAVKLPALISDHMVLQAGQPVRIWGTADAGESVLVLFQGQTVNAKAAANGKWEAWLKPMTAGGPLEMTINGTVLHDVLVGEVWLGSGQSNMELTVQRADNKDEEIAKADYPSIRIFHVKRVVADQPAEDVQATWEVVTPKSIPGFSAVEYYFGRQLHQTLKVPMGLIESDWGGTPAQSWTSKQALQADLGLKPYLDAWDKILADYPTVKEGYDKRLETWNDAVAKARAAGTTPPARPPLPQGPGHQNTPAGLYNGMIAPLTPYAIRGVIWYQGESNANEAHAYKYRRLFSAMIQDWRNRWGQGDFPFLFVQLPNYQTNGWWPVLRESQAETTRLNNVGMAVTIDVGDAKNLHPTNKQDVAKRLVSVALNMVYHQPVEYSGPTFQQLVNEGSQLRIYYSHAQGLAVKDGGAAVTGFTIAGDDGKFVPAEARVEAGTVVVSSPQVLAPVAVRYAWADAPVCNLINGAGLPGTPFRSDEPHYN